MKRIRVKVDPYHAICDCLEAAVERGCNRHDKYSEVALSDTSRALLKREIEASFWLAMSDRNLEVGR